MTMINTSIPLNLSMAIQNEPMIYASECLALHSDLLTQLLYLKITIAILSIAVILFMLSEYKRNKNKK